MPPDTPSGGSGQSATKNMILAGEPETFSDYASHPYHMVSKESTVLNFDT